MRVTVAICTRDRAASLAETLSSFERLNAVGCDWEIVVVDNASRDGTRSLIQKYETRLPVRYEFEANPGLSNARNRGVAAASGEYIAWTDDDVLVDKDWLAAYVRAFERWPRESVFGGRITPLMREPCPLWFRNVIPRVGQALAARDLADMPVPLVPEEHMLPFGANYAVRTADQRLFRYDPDLGAGPGRRRVGEETSVILAMLKAGLSGRWVPDCRVEHVIGAERQTTRYIAQYFKANGSTSALQDHAFHGRRHLGVPRWLWRRTIARGASYAAARITAPSEVWVDRLIAFAEDMGRGRVLSLYSACAIT